MGKKEGESAFSILTLSNPVFANLELTYLCEGGCPGCPALQSRDRNALMPASRWKEILKDLTPFLMEVHLTGGEPTAHPEFFQILGALEEIRLPYRLYTNGCWNSPAAVFKALGASSCLRGVVFAFHGSGADVHQEFMGAVDYDRIVSHIKKAVKKGLPVFTASVLGTFNMQDVPGILKSAMGMGSQRHTFQRYIGPYRSGISLYRESAAWILSEIDRVPPQFFSYRAGECFPRCFYHRSKRCLAGITHITINPMGNVKACPFSGELLGPWEKEGEWRVKAGEWSSDFNETCLCCEDIDSCMGGCRVMRRDFLFRQDPLMAEPAMKPSSPETIADDRPIVLNGRLKRECDGRPEGFGYLLIHEGEVIPVNAAAMELLDLCDGTRESAEIERLAGIKAKEFLLSLYVRGFITLV